MSVATKSVSSSAHHPPHLGPGGALQGHRHRLGRPRAGVDGQHVRPGAAHPPDEFLHLPDRALVPLRDGRAVNPLSAHDAEGLQVAADARLRHLEARLAQQRARSPSAGSSACSARSWREGSPAVVLILTVDRHHSSSLGMRKSGEQRQFCQCRVLTILWMTCNLCALKLQDPGRPGSAGTGTRRPYREGGITLPAAIPSPVRFEAGAERASPRKEKDHDEGDHQRGQAGEAATAFHGSEHQQRRAGAPGREPCASSRPCWPKRRRPPCIRRP